MTAIELKQAKASVEKIFQSALDGEEVIITEDEKPVLKLMRIEASAVHENDINALGRLRKVRISATSDFSVKADLYPFNGTDE